MRRNSMTIKTLRLSILVLIPLVAMACAHVKKAKSINDNGTIYLEDPLEQVEGDWVMSASKGGQHGKEKERQEKM